MFSAFGDSITAGMSAAPQSMGWVQRFMPINSAVPSAQAADISNYVLGAVIDENKKYSVFIGANDIYRYGNNGIKKTHFERCLTGAIAWLTFPQKVSGRNMIKSGNWWNATVNNVGIACSAQGNTAKATVYGDKIYIGYLIQDHPQTTGTADIKIDGVVVGQINCSGAGMTTNLNASWGHAASCFEVAPGEHEIEIIVTSSGSFFYVNWVAGNQQNKAKVFVSNILKWKPNGYLINGFSPSITDDYNNIISNVISKFDEVALVDNHSLIDPAQHLADNVHPNNLGHEIIHNNFKEIIFQGT